MTEWIHHELSSGVSKYTKSGAHIMRKLLPKRAGGHIGYVPRERLPFSVLNFRSGASSFYLFFLLLRGPSFSKFIYRKEISSHSWPPTQLTAASPNKKHSGRVSGRPECQPDTSYIQSVPETPLSRSSSLLSPAFSRSSSFRSPTPIFSLCRSTYLPNFRESHPRGWGGGWLCNFSL